MNFADAARLLLRHWIAIAAATIVIAAGVTVFSMTRTPVYTATTAEYFSLGVGSSAGELASGANYVQSQMSSFGELATAPIVLDPVIEELELDLTVKELARTIAVASPRDTSIMQIDVTSADPERAAAIANAVGEQLSGAVETVGPKLPNGKSLVRVQQIQTALPPTIQSSPNTSRNAAAGLIAGFLLSCVGVIVLSMLDGRIRTLANVSDVTVLPSVGVIRQSKKFRASDLVTTSEPNSPETEDIRRLRANVVQIAGGEPLSLAITSALRGEGRTVIAANLAASLAESGRTTLLIDADLHRPRIAALTDLVPSPGLVDVLTGKATAAEATQKISGLGLEVMTSGSGPTSPSALLSSTAMHELMTNLRGSYEFIIIDTPALLAVGDVTALRGLINGVVVLAQAKRVKRRELRQALDVARTAGVPAVGIVLNDVPHRDLGLGASYVESDRETVVPKPAQRGDR